MNAKLKTNKTAKRLKKRKAFTRMNPRQQEVIKTRKLINGIIIKWTDKQPLDSTSEPIPSEVNHVRACDAERVRRAMVAENFHCEEVGREQNRVINKWQFLWRVEIAAVFISGDGERYSEDREFVWHGKLSDVNSVFCGAIKEAYESGNPKHYDTCEFTVTCLGDRKAVESDYS